MLWIGVFSRSFLLLLPGCQEVSSYPLLCPSAMTLSHQRPEETETADHGTGPSHTAWHPQAFSPPRSCPGGSYRKEQTNDSCKIITLLNIILFLGKALLITLLSSRLGKGNGYRTQGLIPCQLCLRPNVPG